MERKNTHKGPGGRKKRWGYAAVLAVLLAAAAFFFFEINGISFCLHLLGEETVYLEYGDTYPDPGVQPLLRGGLLWKDGLVPNVSVEKDSALDETILGTYQITYHSRFLWWKAEAVRTVWVVDKEKPMITLMGDGAAHIAGTPYQEEGFSAWDNYDGDITHRVVRTEDMGCIRYTVLDSSGNFACAQRQVPYYDPVPPDIVLEGGTHLKHPAGQRFSDPGYTALDIGDGDVTELVSVEGTVLWYRPGVYPVNYRVSDSHGNEAQATRMVEVQSAEQPETIYPDRKTIYLTFDDGPGPYTRQLLDILDQYQVKATFFVCDTDSAAEMKAITDRGHSIGIHSVTHNYGSIYTSPEAFFDDLYAMQEIIFGHTGVRTTLMRFPGGSSNTVSRFNPGIMTLLTQAVEDAGFQYFDWNVDSNDAGGALRTATVRNNVIEGVLQQEYAVVLQHDIHPFSVAAVEEIILWGRENGYQFLPLTENSPPVRHDVNN